jgi:hypothetical protein
VGESCYSEPGYHCSVKQQNEAVHLVCLVYLVDLVYLVSFAQPKDETNQIDQMNQILAPHEHDRGKQDS